VIQGPHEDRDHLVPLDERSRLESGTPTSDPTRDDPAISTPGFRRLTRDSFVYGLGTVSGKAMGLVLLPVLARTLSRDNYGLLDVLWSLGTGIAGILLFGLDAATVRLYFDDTHRHRANLLATWGVILATTAIAAAIALVFAAPWIAQWIGPTGSGTAPFVLALVVPATLTNYFAVTALRTAGRPGAYAVVSIATFALYGATVIGLALAGKASVATIMGAWGISLAITSVLGLALLRSTLVGQVQRASAVRLLRYGLPLAPVLSLTLTSEFVQRAILLSGAGATEVAQLTVALRFASVEALVITAFQLAWQPRVFAMGTTDLALRRIAVDARRFLWLAAAAALALAVVMPAVVPIVAGGPYRGAVATVGWCLAATLLAAAYAMATTSSAIAKRPGDITRSTVAGIATAVLANIILAPRLGSVGTGIALVAGQVVAVLTALVYSRRAMRLPGPWLNSALVMAATLVATVVWTATAVPAWISLVTVAVAGLALLADATLRDSIMVAAGRRSNARDAGRDGGP
jgi:O-antigen/teichoic acid export membrane protein